ncbi:hypothetical protein ACFL2C_00920 [Patescibacteria group bacterium]
MNTFWTHLFFHELAHLLVASLFAIIVYSKTKSISRSAFVVLISLLIDVDHFYDYFAYNGLAFDLFDAISGNHFLVTGKAYVPLHAWEWLFVMGIFFWIRGWKSVFAILFFALLAQLVVDSVTAESVSFYSISIRALNGFARP